MFGPRTVAVRDGEISVKQAAAEIGIPADAVYNWLRHGQVPARRSRRTLARPLGFRDAGDLPAEGRQLVPAQTDTSDAAQTNATDGNRPLIARRHTARHAWPWPLAAV
jgi:hypothetical protein